LLDALVLTPAALWRLICFGVIIIIIIIITIIICPFQLPTQRIHWKCDHADNRT